MKKSFAIILIIAMLICSIFALSACKKNEHTWNTEYFYDDENHWLKCDDCEEIKGKNNHNFEFQYDVDSHWQMCTDCGYKRNEIVHSYNDDICECGCVIGTVGLEYELVGDSYSFVGLGTSVTPNIKISSFYNNKKVTSIGDNYDINNSIFKGIFNVVIPNTITYIGFASFFYSDIESIVIPDSVKKIGAGAFSSCHNLKQITIGKNVKQIEYGAFADCSSLENIILPDGLESLGLTNFSSCDNLKYNEYKNGLYLGSNNNPYLAFIKPKSNNQACLIYSNTKVMLGKVVVGETISSNYTLEDIKFDLSNSNFITKNNCILTRDGKKLVLASDNCIIPNGVTTIGAGAFAGTNNKNIIIPDSVEIIEDGAFVYSFIENLKLSSNLKRIDSCAFLYYLNPNGIFVPKSVTTIEPLAFYPYYSENFITYCEVESQPTGWNKLWNAFGNIYNNIVWNYNSNSSQDTNINVMYNNLLYKINGDTATLISAYNYHKMIDVMIPDSIEYNGEYYNVTSIDDNVRFHKLTSLKIGNNIINIPNEIFSNCRNLINVTIGNGVKNIGYGAFSICTRLTYVTIGNNIESIGKQAFYRTSLKSITIPRGVSYIGSLAFNGCDIIYCEVESQPSGWNSDWNYFNCPVVWNCHNNDIAEDGYIHACIDGIKYILREGVGNIFTLSTLLNSEVIIPNSVEYKGVSYKITSIGDRAFAWCSELISVIIPNSIKSIGYQAFYGCKNLTQITIPDSVIYIDQSAFSECIGLTSIIVDEDNVNFKSEGKCLLTKDGLTLILGCKTSVIPNSVTRIGDFAFDGCISLTSIIIPNSVINIGNYAFSNCTGLTNIIIPKSVRYIGRSAFSQCNLTIYCEAESQPYSWEFDWLEGSQSTVVWGDKSDPTIPTEPSDEIKLFMPVEDGVQGGRPFSDTTLSYDPTLGQYNLHVAVDIVAKEGKNIYAGCDGVIINIKIDDYIGGIITIDYGKGFVATFTLVADINVNIGDKVTATSIIGKVGVFQFECKQESHLHFELTKFRKQVDPMLYIISKTNY